MAVLDGASVSEVAAEVGVSRQSVHAWVAQVSRGGLAGLADRSSRPRSSPSQASPEMEARVCELRRAHPRWGAQRIVHELMRGPALSERLPSRATVHRILVRHGLVVGRPRRRKRSDYVRWQRPAAMQLWQIDIVYGPRLVDTGTGELREARIVTGVDDHSRFCVIARVVERATGRAICLAFAEALERYGAPEEVLTDNGKQFTDRFGRGGEVLFDKICRRNGIAHRLTQPSSPTTTGKIERFHQTLRRELLDDARPFVSLLEAQAALDDWVREYNADRPHQALETTGAGHPVRALPAGVGRAARAVGAVAARRAVGRRRAGAHRDRRAGRRRRRGAGGRSSRGRSSSIGSSRRRGTCGSRGRQFWLGPAGPGRPSASGPASTSSTSRSPAPASRACARTGRVADLAQLKRDGRDSGRPAAAADRRARGRRRDRGRPHGQQHRPGRPRRSPAARRRDPRAAAGSRSGSSRRRCCSSTRRRASCSGPARTR